MAKITESAEPRKRALKTAIRTVERKNAKSASKETGGKVEIGGEIADWKIEGRMLTVVTSRGEKQSATVSEFGAVNKVVLQDLLRSIQRKRKVSTR